MRRWMRRQINLGRGFDRVLGVQSLKNVGVDMMHFATDSEFLDPCTFMFRLLAGFGRLGFVSRVPWSWVGLGALPGGVFPFDLD